MTDEIPTRVSELEKSFAAMNARAEERLRREKRIEEKVDCLIDDMNQRHGRENANKRTDDKNRENKHETGEWLRAFIPTGIWVAFWSMIVWVAQKLGSGIGGG